MSHSFLGKPAALFEKMDIDWAPSINVGHNKVRFNPLQSKVRHERQRQHSKGKHEESEKVCNVFIPPKRSSCVTEDAMPAIYETFTSVSTITKASSSHNENNSQTDLKSKDILDMECQLKKLMSELRAEITDSLTQMQYEEGTEAGFENRDEKVLFCTGLPNL